MSQPTNEYDDRHFAGLLREAAGDGPAADLVQRTMTAVAEDDVAKPTPTKYRRTPAVVIALAAAAVVTIIALLQPGDDTDNHSLQDPERTPPEELIERFNDEALAINACQILMLRGAHAVPALRAAIGKPDTNHLLLFRVLQKLEARAVPALPEISQFILDAKVTEPALGRAFRAAAEIAPFAAEAEQEAARRAILITAFSKAGPAAPAAKAAIGGARENKFSLRDVGRMQHRLALGGNASTDRCLDALANGSPFERELAARLLRDHRDERIVPALRKALRTTHPQQVKVAWQSEASSGNFAFSHRHDPVIHVVAARSLTKLLGTAPEAAAAHAFLLRVGYPDADSQAAAAQAFLFGIGVLGSHRKAAAALARTEAPPEDRQTVRDALVATSRHGDVELLREVVTALGHYGPLPDAAIKRLQALTRHDDKQVRARAQATLTRLSK